MRIFLTGASGFIGSRILPALQASGHQVIGLARSESTAQALKAAGAEVHRHAGCPGVAAGWRRERRRGDPYRLRPRLQPLCR